MKITFAIAAAAVLVSAAPALAADPAPRATIRTADLDLGRASDVRKLDRRVASATEKVCGSYAQARDGEEERIAACRAEVARQLEPQLAALRAKVRLARR